MKKDYNAITLSKLIEKSTMLCDKGNISKSKHKKNLFYILKNINKILIKEDNYSSILNFIDTDRDKDDIEALVNQILSSLN